MTKVSAKAARDKFSETIDLVRINHERVVVQRNGKDVVAMVPIEDFELLERLEDGADVAAAKKALADPARIPLSEVKKLLGL